MWPCLLRGAGAEQPGSRRRAAALTWSACDGARSRASLAGTAFMAQPHEREEVAAFGRATAPREGRIHARTRRSPPKPNEIAVATRDFVRLVFAAKELHSFWRLRPQGLSRTGTRAISS
jgi:hypothetical protein